MAIANWFGRRGCVGGAGWLGALSLWVALSASAGAWAQAPAAPKKPPPKPPARTAAPVAAASAPAAPALPSGRGWRSAAAPAWVVEPPAAPAGTAPAPAMGARRELVLDLQQNYTLPRPQMYLRHRAVALDASALGSVSQPQIGFNPAFQTVLLHSVAVLRDGRRIERLGDVRIETMRREQRLEQQVLDGTETLLVVVSDLRVGEPVEVIYTIEGENPIFEGRIATGMRLGYETPLDLLHYRIMAPAGRELQVKTIAGDLAPERSTDSGVQVLRLVRHQVPGVVAEQAIPPWFKAYPALLVSDYRSWAEVDAWAQRLFALPSPAHPAIAQRAQAFRATGLQGEALVSEVLRFVQDEVRYLSISLGESSHRPKPPQQTLAELLGDCKDKVMLLNALLGELGFQVRPALVSTVRNRGLADFLPGHDEIDHVVTQLVLEGRTWLLDGTINGQGLTLATRGRFPYGRALVVGGGGELITVPEPEAALNRLDFEQRWDLSSPGKPVVLTTLMRAHGLAAERWRAGLAGGGVQRVADALASGYTRIAPGLQQEGEPTVKDDRQANVLEFTLPYRHADYGQYERGALQVEFAAVELLDALVAPQEPRRRTPWLLDVPRIVESRIVVTGSQPVTLKPPAPLEVADRHFRYTARVEVSGRNVTIVRRYERRADQVLAADLVSYRENIVKARTASAGTLRLALFDTSTLQADLERAERRLRSARGWRNDALGSLLARNEFTRIIDGKVLDGTDAASPLAARVRASRAQAANLLGDFAAGLADADAALALRPDLDTALEARGVALLGSDRAEDALASFTRLSQGPRRPGIAGWLGTLQLTLGRPADAEKVLRDAVDNGEGEERDFALIWLYLAAEQQGRRGQAVLAPYLDGVDESRWSGSLLRYLGGRLDRDALLKKAREKPEMERLNMAEATFYIGRQLAARGERDEALKWYQRTVETEAVPYREVTLAKLELQRAGKGGR